MSFLGLRLQTDGLALKVKFTEALTIGLKAGAQVDHSEEMVGELNGSRRRGLGVCLARLGCGRSWSGGAPL